MEKKLLIISAAALSRKLQMKHLEFQFMESIFPALTCTAQASFRTGTLPGEHGMVSNGFFHRTLKKAMFWEQSSSLVQGPRIWDDFRKRGKRVAMLFWQQSLGENVDILISPAPIHKHHGGIIDTCYSKPASLYEEICKRVGRPFRLRNYWGPLASWKAGEWIVDATIAVIADSEMRPDLCLTYLPTLDYDLQRKGKDDNEDCSKTFKALERQLSRLADEAISKGYDIVVFGDYSIGPVSEGVLPNVPLRDAGLLVTRSINGMVYPDFFASKAFALTDHEIAHIYVSDSRDIIRVGEVLNAMRGVAKVLDAAEQNDIGVDHRNGGDLLIVAEEGKWFAYPWWLKRGEAPDFAGHVDIHNKPGYDPCELLFGWPPGSVSRNTSRIRGSHGRAGRGREVAWASTLSFPSKPNNLIELASGVRLWLDQKGY